VDLVANFVAHRKERLLAETAEAEVSAELDPMAELAVELVGELAVEPVGGPVGGLAVKIAVKIVAKTRKVVKKEAVASWLQQYETFSLTRPGRREGGKGTEE